MVSEHAGPLSLDKVLTVTLRRYIPGAERIAFVKAVECLMQQPNIYPNVTGPKYGLLPSRSLTNLILNI
jgi:hypothetical protein